MKFRRSPLTISFKVTATRLTIAALLVTSIAGCAVAIAQNAQTEEFRTQDKIASKYQKSQPIPVFAFSQKRQNLIEIEKAEAEGVQTTSFLCPGLGCTKAAPPMEVCPSIGAPIPTTEELTNPEQPLRDNSEPLNNGGGNVTVGEMDPTGTYKGASEGTYVMCIGKGGSVIPSYWEGHVEVEFAPAVWNEEKGQIEDVGPPSFQFSKP